MKFDLSSQPNQIFSRLRRTSRIKLTSPFEFFYENVVKKKKKFLYANKVLSNKIIIK